MTEKAQKEIFETWLQDHQALLFKVVRAYAVQAVDREDLFQEICLQVWQSVPRFRAEAAVTTWLYRIALRTAITWKKKAKRSAEQAVTSVQKTDWSERSGEKDDRLDWLYAEIVKLDKIDRSLALLLLDEFSYKEMAAMLGISESNVGVKIHRIKQHLMSRAQKSYPHGF
jgi:RNA polymerase sigma-70 factor (ECF subfamily)